MSFEFLPTDGKREVIDAALNIEQDVRQSENIYVYLDSIHHEFTQTDQGRGELGQMKRAAEFITNKGRDSDDESIYAFTSGELLGQAFLQKIAADPTHTESLAQRYMSSIHKESLNFSSHQETDEEREDRLSDLALEAQQDLSSGFNPSPTTRAYEKFINRFAMDFEPSSMSNRLYFTMGFRLIVKEYLKRVENVEVNWDLLNDTFRIFNEPNIELVSSERKQIIQKLFTIMTKYGPIDQVDDHQTQEARSMFSLALNQFNKEEQLFSHEDLITAQGFYCVRTTEDGKSIFVPFPSDTEVQGFFDGFTVGRFPSNAQLSHYMSTNRSLHPDLEADFLFTPAMRIKYPSFIEYNRDAYVQSDYKPEMTVEIPLIYKKMYLHKSIVE